MSHSARGYPSRRGQEAAPQDDGGDFRSRTCECMPIPVLQPSLILLVSCPMRGCFLEAILQRTERKLAGLGRPGTVDGLVVEVERREAPRLALGARGRLAARGGYVNPASKGATSLRPGASRRSIASRGSRGTGKPRTLCAPRMRRLGCLKFEFRNFRESEQKLRRRPGE